MEPIQIQTFNPGRVGDYFQGNGEIVAFMFPSIQLSIPDFTSLTPARIQAVAELNVGEEVVVFLQFNKTAVNRSAIETMLTDFRIDFALVSKNCKSESQVVSTAEGVMEMFRYPFHRADRNLILYSSIPKDSSQPRFTLEREEMISKSIKSGNFLNAKRLIELTKRENTEDNTLSFEMAQKLINFVDLMFSRFILDLDLAGEKDLIRSLKSHINNLKKSHNSFNYFEQVNFIANLLSQHYKGIRNSHRDRLVESLKHYTDLCLVRADLGLQTLSNHFHLTKEYISMIFHEGSGETFTEYVERNRIDRAKDLILSTKLSLKEIGHKCGFSTPLTFRRTFRKLSGLSPSEFRMENRNRPELDRSWTYLGKYASKELIFAHTDPPDGLGEKIAQVFAEKVRLYTNGYYTVRTYPESLLGYDTKLLELVAAGGVDFVVAGLSIYAQYLKEMILFLSPFVVTSYKEGQGMMSDAGSTRDMFCELETSGFRILSCWERGFRCLTAKHPINQPSDMKGLRIRVPPNPLHSILWSNLGAEPIPMEIDKVYAALKQGDLDAQENPISTIWAQKFFEVAPYITLTRHMYSPLLLAASMRSWTDISEEHKLSIENAANEAEGFSQIQLVEYEKRMLSDMKRHGCTIIEPKINPWREAMSQGNDIFLRKFGLIQTS